MPEWRDNRKLMDELWPKDRPSAAEATLIAERLGRLGRQDWLEDAIKTHRMEAQGGYSSPRLDRILACYASIAEAGKLDAAPRATADGEQVTPEDVAADRAKALAEVTGWDVERRKNAIAYARDAGLLGREPPLLLRDPASWGPFAVSMAAAADWYVRTHPEKAARLRELGVGRAV